MCELTHVITLTKPTVSGFGVSEVQMSLRPTEESSDL